MEKFILFSSKSLYRDEFRINGFRFGEGQKAACIVGSTRGNEYQQMFTCAKLVQRLKILEKDDQLVPGREILVVPCVNTYSMNIHKRFWSIDNTDINRMFPGYDKGETTQRIAAGLFQQIKDYAIGIQLASFYMRGIFAPHVRMMHTGFEDVEMAKKFGLPYVIVREPRPFDTTTLNYNWQLWNAKAFSIYTTTTDHLDPGSAQHAVDSMVTMLSREGVLKKTAAHPEKLCVTPRLVRDDDLLTIRSPRSGFFATALRPEDQVKKGDIMGRIEDPYDASVRAEITAPEAGTIMFKHGDDMAYENAVLFKMITDPEET
jgi:predicted deacylase